MQIWSFALVQNEQAGSKNNNPDIGETKCEIVNSGPAYELKWCPFPSRDLVSFHCSPSNQSRGIRLEDKSVTEDDEENNLKMGTRMLKARKCRKWN